RSSVGPFAETDAVDLGRLQEAAAAVQERAAAALQENAAAATPSAGALAPNLEALTPDVGTLTSNPGALSSLLLPAAAGLKTLPAGGRAAALGATLSGNRVGDPPAFAQGNGTQMTGAAAFALVIGNTIENAVRIIYFVPDGRVKARYLPSGNDVRSGSWNFA